MQLDLELEVTSYPRPRSYIRARHAFVVAYVFLLLFLLPPRRMTRNLAKRREGTLSLASFGEEYDRETRISLHGEQVPNRGWQRSMNLARIWRGRKIRSRLERSSMNLDTRGGGRVYSSLFGVEGGRRPSPDESKAAQKRLQSWAHGLT